MFISYFFMLSPVYVMANLINSFPQNLIVLTVLELIFKGGHMLKITL